MSLEKLTTYFNLLKHKYPLEIDVKFGGFKHLNNPISILRYYLTKKNDGCIAGVYDSYTKTIHIDSCFKKEYPDVIYYLLHEYRHAYQDQQCSKNKTDFMDEYQFDMFHYKAEIDANKWADEKFREFIDNEFVLYETKETIEAAKNLLEIEKLYLDCFENLML